MSSSVSECEYARLSVSTWPPAARRPWNRHPGQHTHTDPHAWSKKNVSWH